MKNEIRYADLFGGVGGFRLGIERAGNSQSLSKVEQDEDGGNRETNEQGTLLCPGQKPTLSCVFYSDIDKYSVQTYNKNFNENYQPTDIRQISTDDIPEIDMLCGGFPCQAFSIAGKRRGFEDTRGTLFFEIARIIKAKRPKIIFLENVKGLLNHNQGETFRTIIQTISELGYDVQWMVLNSKFFGVPQNRERVFIIGSIRGTSRPEILPFRRINQEIDEQRIIHGTITEAMGRQGSSKEYMSSLQQINSGVSDAQRVFNTIGIAPTLKGLGEGQGAKTGLYAVLTPDRPEKRQNGRRFKEDGEPMFTLTGQDKHGIAIMDLYNKKEHTDRSPALTELHHNTLRVREDMKIRRLTPTECERLQGFPDGWTEGVSDTQRYKQMGNAVTVNVIEAIARKLLMTQNTHKMISGEKE